MALLGAGMQDPATIKAQMRLADFRMVETMLTATAASSIIFYAANRIGYASVKAKPGVTLGLFPLDGNIIGGALIGVGMALTGGCPGSVLVQAGTGVGAGIFTAIGGVMGAALYVVVERAAAARRSATQENSGGSSSSITSSSTTHNSSVSKTLNISPATMVMIWQAVVVGIISLLRKVVLSADDKAATISPVSPIAGGLLMGFSQLVSIILTRSSVGVSTAYEDVARYVLGPVLGAAPTRLLTPAVLFASGILSASTAMNYLFLARPLSPAPATIHVLGGATLLFGARLAKGCPSGHGISGIPAFGWSSFATIAAAFAAGIVCTAAIRVV
ncbi:hypothetical protein CAC42_2622 [Sphaceloma murrayae]|uniref:Uncharacterized protein n=1 Tax=Sphaceloma murrayae TaxID=2082308 RepID=A0A2K1QHD7_9PEZI|nr:hypothetical protein CAC42_2622 [Sphaceloma murrayae]